MKKIWLVCLCLASLSLYGCFHVPDKDWLPSRNKVKTENVEKNDDVDQAINSLVDWIDMISSEWDKMNDDVIEDGEIEETPLDTQDGIISDEEIVENEEMVDELVEDDTTYGE